MEAVDITKLIDVFNDYTSTVFYKYNNIYRSWDIPGAVKKIPLQELYEVANSRGGRVLFGENMLLIKDSAARTYIGLPELDKYNPSLEEIKKLLLSQPVEELEEVLQYCSNVTMEKIVQVAVDLPVPSVAKGSLIHEYSGTNVFQVIEEKKELQAEGNKQISTVETTSEEGKPVRRKKIVES